MQGISYEILLPPAFDTMILKTLRIPAVTFDTNSHVVLQKDHNDDEHDVGASKTGHIAVGTSA